MEVKLSIYDITEKLVLPVLHEIKSKGRHEISLNGDGLSEGIFYYRIEAGGFSETRTMIIK